MAEVTTPVGVKIEGEGDVTPDVAKMAGTKYQKQGQLDGDTDSQRVESGTPMDAPAQTTLSRARRLAQVGEGVARGEREEAGQVYQKSKQLQSLGQLGDRVQKAINQEFQKVSAAPAGAPAFNEEAKAQYGEEALAGIQGLIGDPATKSQGLAQLATLMGKDPSQPLSVEDLHALYPTQEDAVAAATAMAVTNPDQFFVSDSILQSIGTSQAEMEGALGLPAGALAEMTVSEFVAATERGIGQEFNEIDSYRDVLSDPNATASDRQFARKKLKEAGYTGTLASDAAMDRLVGDLESVGEVEFGGSTYSIDELLDDKNISAMVKDYLFDPESASAKKLAEASPDLVEFISNNAGAFSAFTEDLEDDVLSLSEINKKNAELAEISPDMKLSDEVMEGIFGDDWGTWGTEALDVEDLPGFAIFTDTVDADGDGIPDNIQDLRGLATIMNEQPAIAAQLMAYTPDQLKKFEFNNPEGNWAKLQEVTDIGLAIQDFTDEDVQQILGIERADGTPIPMEEVNSFLENMGDLAGLGIIGGNDWENLQEFVGEDGIIGKDDFTTWLGLDENGKPTMTMDKVADGESVPDLPDEMDIGLLMQEAEMKKPYLYLLERFPQLKGLDGNLPPTELLNDMTDKEIGDLYLLTQDMEDGKTKYQIKGKVFADTIGPVLKAELPYVTGDPQDFIPYVIDSLMKDYPDEDMDLLLEDPARLIKMFNTSPSGQVQRKFYDEKQLADSVAKEVSDGMGSLTNFTMPSMSWN